MALHAVAAGDPGLIPIVERTRFARCVEPQATNCPRACACAGFAASVLLPLAFRCAKRSGSVLPGGGFNKWLSLSPLRGPYYQ